MKLFPEAFSISHDQMQDATQNTDLCYGATGNSCGLTGALHCLRDANAMKYKITFVNIFRKCYRKGSVTDKIWNRRKK